MKQFLLCIMLTFGLVAGLSAESKTEKYDPDRVSQLCVDVNQDCILNLDSASLVECEILKLRTDIVEYETSLGDQTYSSRYFLKVSGVEVRYCVISNTYNYQPQFEIENRIRGGDLS